MAGRPLELNVDIIRQVGEHLPRTLFIETVADKIGVHRETLRLWIKAGGKEQRRRDRGKEPLPKYDLHCALVGVIQKALSDKQANLLAGIEMAGEDGAWQAMAWLLERRFPGQWGSHKREVKELRKQLADLLVAVATRGNGPAQRLPARRPVGPAADRKRLR